MPLMLALPWHIVILSSTFVQWDEQAVQSSQSTAVLHYITEELTQSIDPCILKVTVLEQLQLDLQLSTQPLRVKVRGVSRDGNVMRWRKAVRRRG